MFRAGPPPPKKHSHEEHAHSHEEHAHDDHSHLHSHEEHSHDDHSHDDHSHDDHSHEEHSHGSHPHHDHFKDLGQKALLLALLANGLFFFVELWTGLATGSLALLSDASHMLTDVLGLFVAYIAARLRHRPQAGRSTFGLQRLPVLGGLVNGMLSLIVAIVIVIEAIERFRAPPSVPGLPVVIVAVLGLVVNVVSALWLHRSGDHGVNARGAMVHMLGDALGSVAAIVSGVVLLTTNFVLIDAIVSVLVAGIVAMSALPLLRDVVSILLERAPPHLDLDALSASALAMPEVESVLSLHAWELDSGVSVTSLVVVTKEPDLQKLAAAADRLRADWQKKFGVGHATLEWRPVDNAQPCCLPTLTRSTARAAVAS